MTIKTRRHFFRIEPENPYPTDYKPYTEVAKKEKEANARPAIKNKVDDRGEYDTVFIGCPVWWWTAPISTHGGSGWSGTIEDIKGLVPNATMVNGYSISRNNTATSRNGILNWLQEINMTSK